MPTVLWWFWWYIIVRQNNDDSTVNISQKYNSHSFIEIIKWIHLLICIIWTENITDNKFSVWVLSQPVQPVENKKLILLYFGAKPF